MNMTKYQEKILTAMNAYIDRLREITFNFPMNETFRQELWRAELANTLLIPAFKYSDDQLTEIDAILNR